MRKVNVMALEWQGDHVKLLSVMSRGKPVYEVRYFVDGVEKRKRVPKGEQPKDYAVSVERSFMLMERSKKSAYMFLVTVSWNTLKCLRGRCRTTGKIASTDARSVPARLRNRWCI